MTIKNPTQKAWDDAIINFHKATNRMLDTATARYLYHELFDDPVTCEKLHPWKELEYFMDHQFKGIDMIFKDLEKDGQLEGDDLHNLSYQLGRFVTACTAIFQGKWSCVNCGEFKYGNARLLKGMRCGECTY